MRMGREDRRGSKLRVYAHSLFVCAFSSPSLTLPFSLYLDSALRFCSPVYTQQRIQQQRTTRTEFNMYVKNDFIMNFSMCTQHHSSMNVVREKTLDFQYQLFFDYTIYRFSFSFCLSPLR